MRRSTPQSTFTTLSDAVHIVDGRVTALDQKIAALDKEILDIKAQMQRARGGTLTMLKQKGVRALRQKKIYEGQRDQLQTQSFSMDQANFVAQQAADNIATVNAMREGSRAMKGQLKALNIDSIENLQYEIQDMFDFSAEVQDVLSRSYCLPDGVDEAEIEAELNALETDMEQGEAAPAYLDALPLPSNALPTTRQPVRQATYQQQF
ncbi:SNF7 family protein [Pelomyxa schiedti]|nr:SNF7 family protein [Pelomyxa schiedti]